MDNEERLARLGPPALALRDLRKSYGRPVLDGLTLTAWPGEIYALLGPNGAGKTTSLRLASGLLHPDSGTIIICGVDMIAAPRAAKALLAWLPDEPLLYDRLTPLEYLEFVAGLWSVSADEAEARAEALLRTLGLWEQRGQYCQTFSRGMKQKLTLAGALIHRPRLMLLDEPLTGLDATAARQVKDILRAQAEEGGCVVISTHLLDVAERLADRIGIIRDGRLIAEGTFAELRARAGVDAATLEDAFLRLIAA